MIIGFRNRPYASHQRISKMNTLSLTLLVLATLTTVSLVTDAARSDDAREGAARKSGKIMASLYLTLRKIAFPKSPYSSRDTVHNRFILLSPGKVLNYYDYYPGDLYSASVKAKNTSAPQALIPPSVMEKWFDIADVVVGGDLNSGDTGKSLAQIYSNILSQMTVKDFKTLYQSAEARYNEASKFLTEPIQNPVNLSEMTTRMQLYSVYQEEYTDQRLKMENKINDARQSKSSLEYELWFQRNFQLLNDRVENAYSKWLVFGQKELTELYKTYLGKSSASAALKDARTVLRASGVMSLDRTRTIYPVSFEPSNWYEYLLPKDRPLSRDMLIAQRSFLQSELDTLRDTIQSTSESQQTAEQTTDALQRAVNDTSKKRHDATESAINARNDCMQRRANNDTNECSKFQQAADAVVDTTFQNAGASAELFSAKFLLKSNQQYQNFIRTRITAFERKISEINTQLDNDHLQDNQVYLGEITEALMQPNETQENDQWMKFYYNSDTTHSESNEITFGISTSVSGAAVIKGIPVQGSAELGLEFARVEKSFSNANLKASGELLRVFIKRPWFKPSLFDNPTLNFVQYDSERRKTAYVSPPSSTEAELADIVNGKARNIYIMPEYVTSFLLARNVKLQFSGVDSKAVSTALQLMGSTSVGISIPGVPFGLNGGVRFRGGWNRVTADRTVDGMIIHIPGAQLIGYYTQVMPQFPKLQDS